MSWKMLSFFRGTNNFLVGTDEWGTRDEQGRCAIEYPTRTSKYIIVKFAFIMVANKRRLRSASSRRNDKLILTDRYHPSFLEMAVLTYRYFSI